MDAEQLAAIGRAWIANTAALRVARAEAETYHGEREQLFGEFEDPYPLAPPEVKRRLDQIGGERSELITILVRAATNAADPEWRP